MLTMLFAMALTQAAPDATAADAPNVTVMAKLPARLQSPWLWPTYEYGHVVAWAPPRQWVNPMPMGGYMTNVLPRELQGLVEAAERNGGLLRARLLTPRERDLKRLGEAIDAARAK